ncbi:cysteine-rich RECEPTOR-like kinase [Rhynchospora pubera]|uniref:Cysteine-rich RECEPTOR-like kinase n=1 Tax=Rhynchospora pubera TaxID=906938 RepID=A0AAV8EVE1_9POAL|nr:cysteine-rich RECEPTOR-like kinase [Rhynchospora pubera]
MNLIPATVGIVEILLILAAILFHKATQRNQLNSTTRDRSNGDARLCAGAGSVDIVQYRLRDLEKATDYFSDGNRIGKGGFGEVYKGRIGGEIVAIKLLHGSSVKLLEDIAKEVSLLFSLNNKNIVKLLGFCSEAGRYLLVYEYISNGDLRGCLVDDKKRETLNWDKRFKIIEGIAGGLCYLHHNSENVVIHRDLKPENILLDKQYTPKIADFGLSRVFETVKTHKSTRKIAGTLGYFAPELWLLWQYSTSSDVYSYGLLVLEILAGCTIPRYAQANQEILSHAMWKHWKDKKPIAEVIDSSIQKNSAMDQIARCCVIGLLCVQHDSKRRPNMEHVLQMLRNNNIDLPTPYFPGFFQEYARPPDSRGHMEIQSIEYDRPEDSNTSVEYQPTEIFFKDARTSGLQPSSVKEYSLEDLEIGTDNFSYKIGDQYDIINYKGLLDGQTVILVKYSHQDDCRLFLSGPTAVSIERKRKFKIFNIKKRIIKRNFLPFPRHPNMVNILGYCSEVEDKVFVIYDYPKNGNLYDYLFGRDLIRSQQSEWRTRVKIIKGLANGISCLHHGFQENYLIHRNLTPSNIFLDDYWNAKLIYEPKSLDDDIISTSCVAFGYIAPETMTGRIGRKADVYSYGVNLLQILSGKVAVDCSAGCSDDKFLVVVARMHWKQNNMLELLDPRLKNNCPEEEALRYFQIALLCIQYEPEMRPSMQQVSQMLNSDDPLPFPARWTNPSRGELDSDSDERNISGGSLGEETFEKK